MDTIDKFHDELLPYKEAMIAAQEKYFSEWEHKSTAQRDNDWKEYRLAADAYEKKLAEFQGRQ